MKTVEKIKQEDVCVSELAEKTFEQGVSIYDGIKDPLTIYLQKYLKEIFYLNQSSYIMFTKNIGSKKIESISFMYGEMIITGKRANAYLARELSVEDLHKLYVAIKKKEFVLCK